ncbi:MAG: ABC transporter ATP-binding protein [Pseudomonadota bacterium]
MSALADSGAEIALDGVAKHFGSTRALAPTRLAIERGEILALLGPSGCGKTTLLRLIAGLEVPDAGGTIRFDGADVTPDPIERRRVGMVFQSYALFPNMSVAQNVGYALRVRGRPRAEIAERVEEVLTLCRISELGNRPVQALSGGQRQRVALARAVAMRPRALLLDEPLSALDAALREALRDELAALLRALGITAVFVTHDQTEAMAIADRVAVMRAGRIHQLDTPRTVYERPSDAFVASFVGGANRLVGRVEGDHLHLPGGALPLPASRPENPVFLIRPAGLLPAGADAPLEGRLERSIFLGERLRLLVSGIAAEPLTVDAPAGFEPPADGRLRLTLRPGALLAVPEADDHATEGPTS